MSWPLSQDYNEAIQCPRGNFRDPDLQSGEAVTNSLGIPMPRSGNFADVYELRCPNGARWAVKCFTREVSNLRERYAAISRHLQDAKLPFTVDFTFLEQGIRVGGRWYPVLKMQWVEGLTLSEFVRQHVHKAGMLESLLQIWVRMAGRLRECGIAHADLQHGNILLVPYGTTNALILKLVDYDGMFVPALAGIPSGEVGHPCYQHPQRLAERTYSLEVDRFPLLLVATALTCLKVGGRTLWDRYDNGDNLLFREADLQSPSRSPLFYELLKLKDRQTARLVWETLDALKMRLDAVPLVEEVLPELHVLRSPKATATRATPARTTVVKEAAAQAAAPTRQRRKGRLRRVGHSAIVSVAGMVLAGGIVAWRFRNPSEQLVAPPTSSNPSVNSSHLSGSSQQAGKSQQVSEAKEAEIEGDEQPRENAANPPPATPEAPEP